MLLLGLLRRGRAHGYQLNEVIEDVFGPWIDIKKSTIYDLLEKMAVEGWVERRTTKSGNRPPKTVYSVTEDGEAVFQELMAAELASFVPPEIKGDVSVFFVDELPREEAIDLLRKRRASISEAAALIRTYPPSIGGMAALMEHRKTYLAGELLFLDEIIDNLWAKTR